MATLGVTNGEGVERTASADEGVGLADGMGDPLTGGAGGSASGEEDGFSHPTTSKSREIMVDIRFVDTVRLPG